MAANDPRTARITSSGSALIREAGPSDIGQVLIVLEDGTGKTIQDLAAIFVKNVEELEQEGSEGYEETIVQHRHISATMLELLSEAERLGYVARDS